MRAKPQSRRLLDDAQMNKIYGSAITLLEKVGILCDHAECNAAYQAAGCQIGPELDRPKGARQVRFTEAIVREALAKAPKGFTIHPTSPGYRQLDMLSGESYFKSLSVDYLRDLETGEVRGGTLLDMVAMARLQDGCCNIDISDRNIYWMYDLIPKERFERYGLWDIAMAVACLHNGKPKLEVNATATRTEVPMVLRTWQICAGGEEAFRQRPCGGFLVAPVSPYYLSGKMEPDVPWGHADTLALAASAGMPVAIEPCGLLGATGPVTLAGLMAQSSAEFLGLNVAVQTLNPGNPVLMQDFSGTFDMYTGLKQETTPEANLLNIGMTDLAHYLGFPLWAINSSAAAEADAQLGWDTMATLLSQYMHGTDIIGGIDCIAAGSLFDPRALVLADEMVGWIRHFGRGIDLGEETIPLDLMMDLGTAPFGGDFLSAEHTLRNYRDTLWQPSSMTNRLTRDAWIAGGEPAAADRAAEHAKGILEGHQPHIAERQQSELRELIAEVMDREGIAGDEARSIMDRTYWTA